MSEEEMKALVEMNNMLKHENEKLKQDKQELIEMLKKRIDKVESVIWTEESGERHHGASYSDVGYARALKDVLEKLGE